MSLHDSVDGRLLDDRSPSPTNHLNDPNGEKMGMKMIGGRGEGYPFSVNFPPETQETQKSILKVQVALPLLGIMSTKEVAINYLNGTNYMVSNIIMVLLLCLWWW